MDAIIRKHAVDREILHTKDLEMLTGLKNTYTNGSNYYFFFDSELDLPVQTDRKEYVELKNKHIRHLIPYRGRYYDYIVNKEYNTLKEWADENGKNVSSICYGINRIYQNTSYFDCANMYITLEKLLKFLDPNYTGEQPTKNSEKELLLAELDTIIRKMRNLRDTLNNTY